MYDACLHKTKSDNGSLITENEKIKRRDQVSKVLDKMLEQFELIHFHVGNDYWDAFVGSKYQNHPKIVRIKKQQNQPNTRHVYREGLDKYKQGESLPEVLGYLNTIRVANPERESEQSGWWYHPIENPFYGKSNELGKEYGINDGNLFMHYHQDTVQSKHVMGWTNVLNNLRLLKQTDKGQWRLRSQNDDQFVSEERIQEIEQYVLENPPKTKLTNEEKFDVLFDDTTLSLKSTKITSTFISKHDLQSVIGKYHLNGLVESVKWTIEDNALNIDFQSPNKDMIGRVNHANFPLENGEMAVYDTSKLNKLLGVTSGELFLELEKTQKVFTKLIISDMNYTLNFSLTDLLLISSVGEITESGEYEIISELDSESISAIIKAHNALESDNVIINIDKDLDLQDVLVLSFGDVSNHTNKIDYQVPNTTLNNVPYGTELPFNSSMFKTILNNNKDATKATMKVNTKGYVKFEFEGEDWSSYYYVVRKADI
jgi:hypothetical protein